MPVIHSPEDAITMAIQKGVTSGNGRGNGLWILERIVAENEGSLEITSSGARFSLIAADKDGLRSTAFSKASTEVPGTTLVDFQLDVHTPTSIAAALDYEPVNLWLESHEDDTNETDAVIRLAEESKGFGTRISARQMRVMVHNLSREFSGRIVLDFRGVELISTSYADELVSKLLEQDDIYRRLLLRNMNDDCRLVVGEVVGFMDDERQS